MGGGGGGAGAVPTSCSRHLLIMVIVVNIWKSCKAIDSAWQLCTSGLLASK